MFTKNKDILFDVRFVTIVELVIYMVTNLKIVEIKCFLTFISLKIIFLQKRGSYDPEMG